MISATELEDFYTTHHQLGLPPASGVQPLATYNIPCHVQLTATSRVGKNDNNNSSTGATECTVRYTTQLAEAYAASWERSEDDSRYDTPECDGAGMEECSTTDDDDDDTAECAPARAARGRNPNKCTPRISQRQRTRATEMDGAEAHIGESIYEVFQVREDATRITEVLIKNDGGAQVTLVDCVLYDHGMKQGFITNDRKLYRPLRIKGVFGDGGLTRVGTMHVYLPGCDTTTAIQAYRTHEPMSRAHQILLGTDNTIKLGADMSLFKRQTTYHRVPGQTEPKVSIHIDSRSARRQFGSHRLGALEGARGDADEMEFIPESDDAILDDDEHLRWGGPEALEAETIRRTKERYDPRFITEDEETAAIDSLGTHALDVFDHKLRKVERAVKRKDKASVIRRLARIATVGEEGGAQLRTFAEAAAQAVEADEVNTRLKPSESASKTASKLSESISFDIEDDGTKATVAPTARPTSKLAAKGQVKDKAGAGWVRASKAEIKEHLITQSTNMTDDRYLSNEFLDDCIGCSQPPTDQLPSITNHYTFIRFKKDYKRFTAGYRPVPRNLLPRVQRIIDSMVEMDIIEPTDHATNTMPVTLVLGKTPEGETTITRLTIDARECNKALVDDMPEALPTIANLMQHAEGGYVYSTIDLVKAFWQSRIFPPHASRVALRIAGQNYSLKKLFFGIRFGSSTFQQLLQDIVGADLFQERDGCGVFVDDCILWSRKGEGERHTMM